MGKVSHTPYDRAYVFSIGCPTPIALVLGAINSRDGRDGGWTGRAGPDALGGC
jgi:hypothetical protein